MEHGITLPQPTTWAQSLVRDSSAHRWIVRDACLYGANNMASIGLVPTDKLKINQWLAGGVYVCLFPDTVLYYRRYPSSSLDNVVKFATQVQFMDSLGYVIDSRVTLLRRFRLYAGLGNHLPNPEPIP